MRIAAVIVTCNRLALLQRAVASVQKQIRQPDYVYVISNSSVENITSDEALCAQCGFHFIVNQRTNNYAGALNTAVEEIVKQHGVKDDLYFASLDDDDIWLPEYLQELEYQNIKNFDLLVAECLRLSISENLLMSLPTELSSRDFLIGNPGIGGSNTFIRLKTLLKAGCFDEALQSTVDRDFFVRVFQIQPTYTIIRKHLVTAYTDNDRVRLTTNRDLKRDSLKVFYYKHHNLMDKTDKELFFKRAKKFFSIEQSEIEITEKKPLTYSKREIVFNNKGDYQFIIGFIAGDENVAVRISEQIVEKEVPVDLVLMIEDIPKGQTLGKTVEILKNHNINTLIVNHQQWKANLATGHYGSYFKQFAEINSIPLGRTILHHHLYTETIGFVKPVYWIIDDDIELSAITSLNQDFDLFELINENVDKADAIIGSISNDAPVPTLCCIRSQLLDYLHSINSNGSASSSLNIWQQPEYYYDLSDLRFDHLEIPIYHNSIESIHIDSIFSGKAISRPALQRQLTSEYKIITKRGANTLILNRELLQYYPVINLEVNNKFARRGDLLWALLNQVVSGRTILEHTFTVDHNRPVNKFDLAKELDKAAYDIIGYSFNKGIIKVIEKIKIETEPNRPKDIFERIVQQDYFNTFVEAFTYYLQRRKARFILNYYRIIGLTEIIAAKEEAINHYRTQVSDESMLAGFEKTLNDAQDEETLKSFIKELTTAIWTYSKSITDISEKDVKYRKHLQNYFGLKKCLRKLGSGAEGVVFTDENFVYKSFYNILDHEWIFLNDKSICFPQNDLLEKIDCFESEGFRFIRYPFHLFKPLENVNILQIIDFLKFCKQNGFVYTNIKPSNFIQNTSGEIKLIDYGKSFEPFHHDKFINSTKRAYLLWKYPEMKGEDFQKLTSRINIGEEPEEITGWEMLWRAIEPRKKEEILDSEIVALISALKPKKILDYGSGKCKTAKQLQAEVKTEVFVYDIDEEVLKSRGRDLPQYLPNDIRFDNSFDIALLNLVLCEVDTATLQDILSNVSKALRVEGNLVASVCNPDFAHVHKTEFQNRSSIPLSKSIEEVITKTCVYTGHRKTEHHRLTERYLELFEEQGFNLINIIDTEGTNIETLEPASDFKIFILKNAKQ